MYVAKFSEISKSSLPEVGGKALNLGLLCKNGFNVPEGFVVTTEAFKKFINSCAYMNSYYSKLSKLKVNETNAINKLSKEIISYIKSANMPYVIEKSVRNIFNNFDFEGSFAVRSSGTAEDLPYASFAGQHDSYLNIMGIESIIFHIKKCWASLFTTRAILYRLKNGFNHKKVFLSVVVQRMIPSESSGVMFTADPINENRNTTCINAVYGLGETLVQGIAPSDLYKVKLNNIIEKNIKTKTIGMYNNNRGGIAKKSISDSLKKSQVLSDKEILKLSKIGKDIEDFYGAPQDIEWAYYNKKLYILQSRGITTLYPIPKTHNDFFHVYMSFGHQQMMTNAIKPLGISVASFFCMPRDKSSKEVKNPFVKDIGSRAYIDITEVLKTPILKNTLLYKSPMMDELMINSIKEATSSDDFKHSKIEHSSIKHIIASNLSTMLVSFLKETKNDASLTWLQRTNATIDNICTTFDTNLKKLSGKDAMNYIQNEILNSLNRIFLTLPPATQIGMLSQKSLQKKYNKYFGESLNIQTLNKSLRGNVTAEMGLAIGDLGDIARKYPEVLNYLKRTNNPNFIDKLKRFNGGPKFYDALTDFLGKYGMRCPGEIDITNERWIENPLSLIPSIISVANAKSYGEHKINFDKGLKDVEKERNKIISKAKAKGLSKNKIDNLDKLIDTFRKGIALREHFKYCLIRIFWIIKKSILKEAAILEDIGIIDEKEDVYYLWFYEIHDVVENKFKGNLKDTIKSRKEAYIRNGKLNPPRVITSNGELYYGNYVNKDIPSNSLPGIPVSQGVIEGKARVILNPNNAHFESGEILIAPFTDPGWTTLFISSKALVTEVGGLMTHGAVIAREYGMPAVVGVKNATKLIKTGDRIRVNGFSGYVEKINNR